MEKIDLPFSSTYSGVNYKGEPYSYESSTDWGSAFAEAGLDPDNVEYVYAADEGENDGAAWICAGKLKDGSYFFLTAWCDYTGWDCQAGGELFTSDSKEELERMHMSDLERSRLSITLPQVASVSPIVDIDN